MLRRVAIVCLLLAYGLSSHALEQEGIQTTRPNIVLIIADDLGWGDVGYHGSEIQTPAIDALAEAGVQLDRFYAYPGCTPTRGAILSGLRMRTVGLVEPMPPWSDAGLPLHIRTLPSALKSEGYTTWKVGKWHLGHQSVKQFPNERGFDHFYGFLNGEVNYETHVFAGAVDWQRNGKTIEEPGYSTHLLVDEVERLLNDHPTDEPYFLDLSFNAPHTPLQATDAALAEYDHIDSRDRKRFAAMVSEMDRGIGDVLEAISKRDDADRTMVVFISDNGGAPFFGASNGSLKGGKGTHYEGGIRVPALLYWPGVLNAGVREQFTSVHDLYPTFLKLAGAAGATGPGIDIWSAVHHDEPLQRSEPIVFALAMPPIPGKNPAMTLSASLLHDGWKLIENRRMVRSPGKAPGPPVVTRELFNVVNDPYETNDLADENVALVNELAERLAGVSAAPPMGFRPPPKDWALGSAPGKEPDFDPPTRAPYAEAATH